MMNKKTETKYFLLGAVILLLGLAFLILKPFITALITAAIVAYVFLPVHKWLLKRLKSRTLSAIVTLILIILIATIPLALVLNVLTKEAIGTYNLVKEKQISGELNMDCQANAFLCSSYQQAAHLLGNKNLIVYLNEALKRITSFVFSTASSYIVSIPAKILEFFIILFLVFYFLRDSERISEFFRKLLPKKQTKNMQEEAKDVIFAVVYGSVLVALVQGILGTIGFAIFGVPSPILWGFVMIFFALIPFVGAGIIWLPAALWLVMSGVLSNNSMPVFKGIALLVYGILIISSVDNVLKPKIIGERAKVHPAVVLIGAIGGLKLFGLIGFVAGPLILALATVFLKSMVKYNEAKG